MNHIVNVDNVIAVFYSNVSTCNLYPKSLHTSVQTHFQLESGKFSWSCLKFHACACI